MLKFTLALLAGALMTWAVAWGSALWVPWPHGLKEVDNGAGWPSCAPASWPSPSDENIAENSLRTRREVWAEREDSSVNGLAFIGADCHEYGWPLRSMVSCELDNDGDTFYEDQIEPPEWLRGPDCYGLPPGILPLGFTLDTLLYASLMLGLSEGLAFARRRWRHKRGNCPTCNYNRHGLALTSPCPECGSP